MGRSPKPLTILVHPLLLEMKEVQALIGKGHDVTATLPDSGGHGVTLADYDLVLGPTAFRMTPEMMKYIALAIKSARAVKYPKKETKDVPRRKRRADTVAPVEAEVEDGEPAGDGHRGSADGAASAGDP